jgi:hypothetical protein
MKPLVFKLNSWHYWLAADVGNFSKYKTNSNICEYARAVLKGAMIVAVVTALLAALAYWITITVVFWVVVIQYGALFDAPGPMILSAIVGIFGIAAFIAEGIPWMFRKARRAVYDMRHGSGYQERVKIDNFITKAYRSWKEQTCVCVTLIGDDTSDDH